jgi:two-component system chemotaxis response regulator CheB
MHADADYVLHAAEIGAVLRYATQAQPQGAAAMSEHDADDPQLPGHKRDIARMISHFGSPSALTCPECGGALWQVDDAKLINFQCHVGHRYSPESLVAEQDERVEAGLWTAVRLLEERAELRRRMADQTESAGLASISESFAAQAVEAEEQAGQIRDLIASSEGRVSMPTLVKRESSANRKRTRQR